MKLVALFLLGVLPLVALSQIALYKTQLDLSTDLQYAGGTFIYGLAPNGSVYQSSDEGRTYQLLPVSHILSIYNGYKDGLVFLLGSFETNTSYWVDQGKVTAVRLGRYFNQVKLHPTNQNMLLASDKRGGVAYFDLYSTQDATNPNPTMTVVRTKVYDYYHCFAGFAPNPEGRICAISDVPRSGPQRLVVTQDLGKTWDTRIPHLITTFTEHWSFIFAVDIEARLWVSSDNATTFKTAQFPEDARIYRIQAEQILSARPGAVFIGGYPGVDDWGTPRDGNLYVSDTSGTQYALIGDHINSLNNWWDFATIHELEGFYITNYLEGWENDKYVGPNGEVKMRTVMTYDNAANWTYIQAPPGTGCDGKSILGCSLNLYGRTTWLGVGGGGFFGDVYSSWNSVGTVIGTGNAGPYLNNTRESTHTFISHDGGYNWTVLLPHPTIYAINPTYGIWVFVENQVPITSITYYLDGKTAQTLTIDDGKEHICTSLYNPEWSRTFILKCHDFTYFLIDFTNENSSPCVDTDIEQFVPDNKACILGRTTIYQRRVIGSKCALPTDFKSIKSSTNCPCTLARDYECDLGYERASYTSATCRLFNPDQYDPTQNPELCWGKSSYEVSSGYRKISGDTCNTVIPNVQPTTKACPASNTPSTLPGGMSTGGVVALMLFFMLIVGLGAFVGGIIAGHKSHHIRERVPKSWISVESHRLI